MDLNIVSVAPVVASLKKKSTRHQRRRPPPSKRQQPSVHAKKKTQQDTNNHPKKTQSITTPSTDASPIEKQKIQGEATTAANVTSRIKNTEKIDVKYRNDQLSKVKSTNLAKNQTLKNGSHMDTSKPRRKSPEQQTDTPIPTPSQRTSHPKPHSKQQQQTTLSSNDGETHLDDKKKKNEDEEDTERAAYFANFHARPLELDRRAGANIHSSVILDSKSSSHLWNNDSQWSNLGIHPHILPNLQSMYPRPTRIQARAIPELWMPPSSSSSKMTGSNHHHHHHHHHVLIHSETGSGKTLAYALPILQSLVATTTSHNENNNHNNTTTNLRPIPRDAGTFAVILCPTRELAIQNYQVFGSCRYIVAGCLTGGEDLRRKSEKARIRKGWHVIVATPGRFLDHLVHTESLILSLKAKLQWLVLDEADRLFECNGVLGNQVRDIVQRLSANQFHPTHFCAVLVSATASTDSVALSNARTMLLSDTPIGKDQQWTHIRVGKEEEEDEKEVGNINESHPDQSSPAQVPGTDGNMMVDLAESTPRQLVHLFVTVSAKWRLTALIAFLIPRIHQRIVIFVSTCASADYHFQLWNSMPCILPNNSSNTNGNNNNNNNNNNKIDTNAKGLFGNQCVVYKLHGNVPQGERQLVLQKFRQQERSDKKIRQGSILFTTDVAARGLNLGGAESSGDVDWIIQYDAPSEISEYVHRAGRVARAGREGHSLLFTLPSEQEFVQILKHRGVQNITPLSLTTTLNDAAKKCPDVTAEGVARSGGGLSSDTENKKRSEGSRAGEALCCELQYRLEDCVVQSKSSSQTKLEQRNQNHRERKQKIEEEESGLLDLARKAFLSYIRAYPAKEKPIRHIFAAKALHLGHIARSFALKEPPNKLAHGKKKMKRAAKNDVNDRPTKSRALTFHFSSNDELFTLRHASSKQEKRNANDSFNPGKSRQILLANAAKLQSNGLDSL
jgi:ATP-dependent RNA helicase DDX31/DBP7